MTSHLHRSATLLVLALAIGLGGLAGCKSNPFAGNPDNYTPDDEDFARGTSMYVPDGDMLWERVRQTLHHEGFKIDDERTSYAEKKMVTRWKTMLAPTSYEGVRMRVVVHIEQTDPRHAAVDVAVQRQHNTDLDNPLDPAEADWNESDADISRASVYLWKIESFFRQDELFKKKTEDGLGESPK